MDLSHMVVLGLVGQTPGVMPGGVAVVYAPPEVVLEKSTSKAEAPAGWAYPFSADRLVVRGEGPCVVRAGVGLVGELMYGNTGLEGFVPRLFCAMTVVGGGGESHAEAQRRKGGEGEGAAHQKTNANDIAEETAASHAGEWRGMLGAQWNRGTASIGISEQLAFIDRFDSAGAEASVLGRTRVVGFVERPRKEGGGDWIQTCADVAVPSFPVMFDKLVDYLRFAVSAQVEANGYDDLAGVLAKCEKPSHAVVIAGVSPPQPPEQVLTLAAGDHCHAVVYDDAVVSFEEVRDALRSGRGGAVLGVDGVSWLRNKIDD